MGTSARPAPKTNGEAAKPQTKEPEQAPNTDTEPRGSGTKSKAGGGVDVLLGYDHRVPDRRVAIGMHAHDCGARGSRCAGSVTVNPSRRTRNRRPTRAAGLLGARR